MNIIRLITILILSIIIIIMACDDSPTRHSKPPIDKHFPNSTGMLWKYEVYDSLTQITDTVWISYTDNYFVPSGDFFIEWKEKHLTDNIFEFKTVRVKGDTIEIQNSDIVLVYQVERLIYPIELGKSWAGVMAIDDTSRVTLVGQIEVPAETFYNGARIDRSWNLDFEQGGNWSQTWIVPDVGIVSRYFLSQYSDGTNITVTKNETWELIEYDLTTFEKHQFPNKVGNEWIYEEIDSTSNTWGPLIVIIDTISLIIVDSNSLVSGELYTTWEYYSNFQNFKFYVVNGERRITITYEIPTISINDVYYEFPMAVGRDWGVDYFIPVPVVSDKEMIITYAQLFETSFHTIWQGQGIDDYWTREDWLVPGIGFVKYKYMQYGLGYSINRTRTLIDYHLVD
jgi:hypothetical protein